MTMRKFTFAILTVGVCWFATYAAHAQEMSVPANLKAGSAFTISTSGSGDATFYFAGPAKAYTSKIKLGESINIAADAIRIAGHYIVALRSGTNSSSKTFVVAPAQPASLAFLSLPS